MRLKRWTLLLLACLIALTGMPVPTSGASAMYFQFTNYTELNDSTADDPYIYNGATIDLEGTYYNVLSNSIWLTVEQVYESQDDELVVSEEQSYERSVTTSSDSEFSVSSVSLFEGLNRLTLTGEQGNSTNSNEFFILYDSSAYLTELYIQTSNDELAPLNDGVGTVVTAENAYLEGTAPNATEIILNDEYTITPLSDGTFYSPVIELSPGKNTITLTIEGSSTETEISRTVYYYNGQQLIYEGSMYFDEDGDGTPDASNEQEVIGEVRTFGVPFTSGDVAGHFEGKIMVPYDSTGFTDADFDVATLDGDASRITNLTVSNPVSIRYGQDNTITYESYDISFDMSVPTSASTSRDHTVLLETSYGGASGADSIPFTFANNEEKIIESVQLLTDYPDDPTEKTPLDGEEISSSTIYVEVQKNKDFDGSDVLEVYLTPFDPDQTLTVTQESFSGDTAIYKIENIPSGSHTMVFNFESTPDIYDYLADVIYVSGARAVFTNIYDGMILLEEDVPSVISMMFRAVDTSFDPSTEAEFVINGSTITNAFDNYTDPETEFDVDISGNPLIYGANVIQVEITTDGLTSTTEIEVVVVDDDLPTINYLKPVLAPTSGSRPSLSDESDREELFTDLTGFTLYNDVYYTTSDEYDMVIEAQVFDKFQLQYDGEYIIDYDKDDGSVSSAFPSLTTSSNEEVDDKMVEVNYDISGDVIRVRIRDLTFDSPGSQVFTLKITSDTGSQATQRLEIVKEVVSFEVLSPVATTDGKIVVNKNFVTVRIKAEDADSVIVEKEEAERMDDDECEDCFELEYIGLKEDKENEIEFTVVRGDEEVEGTINVYYASADIPGAQYKEAMDSKHSVFNDKLTLEFEKGTLLTEKEQSGDYARLYEDQNILFALAETDTGVVERVLDDGTSKSIRSSLVNRFEAFDDHFTIISPVYWISGGVGEEGDSGSSDYEPSTDGLTPHQSETELSYTYIDEERQLVPTERGELTISYDELVREEAGTTVTVFYFDGSGEWVNLGGVIDTDKHEITVPFDEFGYYVVAKLRYGFSDITNHPWASRILEALYSKGFMSAVSYDEFGPDEYITRGEFAQLLVLALQLELNYDDRNTFYDVQPSSRYGNLWEYKYIETAARAGIVQGLETRVFGANSSLTREQAALMIAKALELQTELNDDDLLEDLEKEFTDADSISYYARPAVMAVFDEEIMTGRLNITTDSNGVSSETYSFSPTASLTRAEAGAIAVRIMQDLLDYFPDNLN